MTASILVDDPSTDSPPTDSPKGAREMARPLLKRKSRRAAAHRGDARLAWILIAPSVVGFAVFAAYPTIESLYLSFTNFRVLTAPTWVGLDNYTRMLSDPVFWSSMGVTLEFVAITVLVTLVLALATAVVMHRLAASTFVRGVMIMPFLVSSVVAGVVWAWMLDSQLGIVNIVLEHLTGGTIRFLSDPAWAIPSLAMINVWKTLGYTTILIFAGLQTIPPQVYEAGRLDGAGEFAMFRRITLPLLRPVMAMVVILTVIGSFQVFDLIEVTTKGGPANASNVLQVYIYSKAFAQFDFGYASTMSIALFVMLIIISFLQMRILRASESDTN
jgi:ABC-type sugar transport system permease subunit